MKSAVGTMVAVLTLTGFFLLEGSVLSQPLTGKELSAFLSKDGPYKGNSKAPVALVEFSDFQCSFCRKFWQTTLPLIEKKYIKSGKVKFVYRHFAILGKHSVAAARASACAHDQGKFWVYHDKLFASAGSLLSFVDGRLKGYARELQLDAKTFDQCLDSGKYRNKVQEETAIAGFLGARGTPAFFLNGKLLPGAQPFHVFEAVIGEELKKTSPPPKSKP